MLAKINSVAVIGLGAEKVEVEVDLLGVPGLFSQRVAAGSEAIADIVVNQSGLDRIQVDDADGLAGLGVDHDIVDLRISVNGANGQFAHR